MKSFKVTWGIDESVVYADDEAGAWAKFCESNDLATKHPKLHERKVEEVKAVEAKEPADDKEPAKSPVEHLNATDATDSISRMHSVEKLNEIVAADQRITVAAAAKKRLSELG